MIGGARRRKLPLGCYVNKLLSRNLSRKNSSKECGLKVIVVDRCEKRPLLIGDKVKRKGPVFYNKFKHLIKKRHFYSVVDFLVQIDPQSYITVCLVCLKRFAVNKNEQFFYWFNIDKE